MKWSGIKFISAQNTSKDYLDLTNVKYISREEYESITQNAKPKTLQSYAMGHINFLNYEWVIHKLKTLIEMQISNANLEPDLSIQQKKKKNR